VGTILGDRGNSPITRRLAAHARAAPTIRTTIVAAAAATAAAAAAAAAAASTSLFLY
jgi:hypothetical protein